MESEKIDSLDLSLTIQQIDSAIIVDYCGTHIHGVTDYSLTAAPDGDVEVMLRIKIKASCILTHEIAAKIKDQRQ